MPRFLRAPRAAIVVLGLSLLLLADGLAAVPDRIVVAAKEDRRDAQSAVTDAVACAHGFADIDTKSDMSLHGVTLSPRGAIAVGYDRRSVPGHNGIRVPATLLNRGNGWQRVNTLGPGDEDGLMAVTTRGSNTWAVGFTTIKGEVKPLAMRWDGRSWKTDRPRVGAEVGLFTDVDIVGRGSPFAVGYRMAADGRRKPMVLRKDGPRWRPVPLPVGKRDSVTLTGVGDDGRSGTWVVGHGGSGAQVKPLIYRRDRGKWKSMKVPKVKGEGVLTDVVATGPKESWAVGYQRRDGSARPLVLRWNGKAWRRAEAPAYDSSDVLLSGASADPSGGIWVVGAAWDDERKEFEAIAAWWNGQTWNETVGRVGGTELHAAAGSLSGKGWAVGRSNGSGRIVRVCEPPQSGVFGSTETAAASATAAVVEDDSSSGQSGHDHEGDVPVDDDDDYLTEAEAAEAEAEAEAANLRNKGRKPKNAANKIGTLPAATVDKRILARDVARPAGIFEETGTYDAVVEDFDGDGDEDIFIGRHGRKGRLMINNGGLFKDHWPLKMEPIDRHGCTTADVDGSGLPDLYCAVGGKRGSGVKSNELWLDPGGKSPVEAASVMGVADPSGRGRLAAFLETDKKRAADLIVTNSPSRVDGLPSLARRFRVNGSGQFSAAAQPGIAARQGARALQDADFDGDGREDLLLVTGGPLSPSPATTRLYRNTRKGLVEVTGRMGIRSFDEVDAELVDLNKDGKLDLVQLSEVKLKVSLQKNGKFKKVFERNLTNGRALASGDVNGDERGDIYIVRSGPKNYPDVMLVNRDDGRQWSSVVIPQVAAGNGDDAYAIDHDGNGLDDFVVLNGHNLRGPTQLIAFYRR